MCVREGEGRDRVEEEKEMRERKKELVWIIWDVKGISIIITLLFYYLQTLKRGGVEYVDLSSTENSCGSFKVLWLNVLLGKMNGLIDLYVEVFILMRFIFHL